MSECTADGDVSLILFLVDFMFKYYFSLFLQTQTFAADSM